jgi:hypothetical protein
VYNEALLGQFVQSWRSNSPAPEETYTMCQTILEQSTYQSSPGIGLATKQSYTGESELWQPGDEPTLVANYV